ncbi:3-oxoacyl-ACP reductase FabG [Nocardia africana]|uniref:3-oxoacyl-ACP reductase FabG n=1 Tax=Nocardia africana TaxID=134964 RepID=A0ABW6NTZ9_9NOCA
MTQTGSKVAVVTGGARGIGAAIAARLAADGARVAIVDLDGESAQKTAAEITAQSGEAVGFACNVAEEASVADAIARITDRWAGVDILVNNAGVIRDNLLFRMSVSDWDTVLGVHLRGSFLWARAVQAHMVEQRWGKIVNLSSTSAYGSRGQANYSAAKAGLQGFTRTLAIELGKFNINVNAIAPGFIETDMTRATAERVGMSFEEFEAKYAPSIPLQRIGQPADIANTVAFLTSDQSSYITGQIINVSGGPSH